MDLKREINSNTIILGELTTSLISMDRSMGQNLSKETTKLTQTDKQITLIAIHGIFHITQNTLVFLQCVEMLQYFSHYRPQHKLHKIINNLNHTMHFLRLSWSETGEQQVKYSRRYTNIWRLNNMLNERWVIEEIKEETNCSKRMMASTQCIRTMF